MEQQIIYYYQRGVASYLIAKKFGVSNSYVRNLLKKRGVKVRGHSVTNKMSADRRTPEENKRITKAASEANRNSVHTLQHRVKLALARERKPTIDPIYEQPLVDLCKNNGVDIIPQKAFSKFNVDLYLVKKNVVIEVFGGGFHNKQDAKDLFNNKINYLSSKKIPVVIVWADKATFSPEKVLKVCMNASEPLTIITGDGLASKKGLNDIVFNH